MSEHRKRHDRTRKKILLTAAKLFSKFGYDGISMDGLARAIKMTKGALYGHFSSKEDIYIQSINHYFKIALGKVSLNASGTDPKSELFGYLFDIQNLVESDPVLRQLTIRLILDSNDKVVRKIVGESMGVYFEHSVSLVKAWRPDHDADAFVYSFFCTALLGKDLQKIVDVMSPSMNSKTLSKQMFEYFQGALK